MISVDRIEQGKKFSALEEFVEDTGIPVHAIANIKEIFEYLKIENRRKDLC